MSDDIVTFERGRTVHPFLNAAGEFVVIECVADCPVCAKFQAQKGSIATVTSVDREAGTITVGRR